MRPPRHVSRLLAAGLALLALGATAAARADVPYTPFDLAAQTLALGDEFADVAFDATSVALVAGAPQEIPECALAIGDGQLSGACPFLWALETPAPLTLALTTPEGGSLSLALARGWSAGAASLRLEPSTREILAPPGFAPDALVALHYAGGEPLGWQPVELVDGRIMLDDDTYRQAAALAGRYTVYAQEGGRVVAYQVLPAAPKTAPVPTHTTATATATLAGPAATVVTSDPTHPDDRGRWKVTAPADMTCPPRELPQSDMIVVCVDATGDVLKYRMVPEGTRLTKPNRYFLVHVLHFVDRQVEVSLGGQVGTFVPGNRGELRVRASNGGRGGGIGGAQGAVQAPDLTVSTQVLAPRLPGYAPLTVRLNDLAGEIKAPPMLVEFWIDETYSGAFRMGFAGVFAGGLEQRYQKVTAPNSQQAEIRASDANPVDVDLVVGYAPYLERGGRSAAGCENAPFCFSPYVGIGVVSAADDGGLDFLKSVHLGVEWEFTPSFSIALTANLRRVQRLAAGYAPGQPIDGDIPTESRYVFGAGLVINLSPSFLKIGASGAAALLQ